MEKLPSDVMVRIFSQLSLKTLFQCMGVCTTWRNIVVHDPHFASMHLTRAAQIDPPSVVFSTLSSSGKSQLCLVDFNSEDCQDYMLDTISTDPFGICFDPGVEFGTILSCNGLLCLCDPLNNNPIYVCNPVTGDHIALPCSPQCTDRKFIPGFGFDAMNNEYKVIRMKYFDKGGPTIRPEAEVYTVGSGVWRSIGRVRYPFVLNSPIEPVNIHGVLHWMVSYVLNPAFARFILAWDVRDEKFRRIPFPLEFGQNKDFYTICLTRYNKCLSILDFHKWYSVKIWVIEDYNGKRSWTMLMDDWNVMKSFTVKASIRQWYGRGDCGEILVNAAYNPEDGYFINVNKIQYLDVEAKGTALAHKMHNYVMNIAGHVGSFVSINGGN